jgi:hypothetical protein
LLLVDEVGEFGVPLVLRGHVVQVQGRGEHVAPQLLQLLALFQKLLGRQVSFPILKQTKKV